jgi:O-methyltransferase
MPKEKPAPVPAPVPTMEKPAQMLAPAAEITPELEAANLETRLRNSLRRRAVAKIYDPHPAPVSFRLRERLSHLFPHVAETIGADKPLTYLEFGVWKGASMRRIMELFTSPKARFYGFDSFEGLPEAWGPMAQGHFSTEGKLPNIKDDRAKFVKGYFQNTLPDFTKDFDFSQPLLVHFDADLYSATLFLLTSLWHLVPEYYFLFDEFPRDEATAFYDFTLSYPVEFEFLASTKAEDKDVHMQVFGKLKRTTYAP